jgi:hypothetical protein
VSRDQVGAGHDGHAEKAKYRTNNQGQKPSKRIATTAIHCSSPFNTRDEDSKCIYRFYVASILRRLNKRISIVLS